ncbi:MAG: T9SS type A sorting domain-containing protein, partial [Treponema sp.]|nr:T9SS type A sorting domain-containing protein [Treponema sp.]
YYDVTLQIRTNDLLSGSPDPIRLVYSFNVDDAYKGWPRVNGTGHGSPGFWLPNPPLSSPPPPAPPQPPRQQPYANIAPLFLPVDKLQPPHPSGVTPPPPLFNYQFSHTLNPDYDDKTNVEFYFHLTGSPPDLYAGRLEMDASAPIPLDWYYRVRPFIFGIHNITRQRSWATILNNVINPTTGERVYLDYDLQKSGRVTIQVFTLDGNLVKILERNSKQAGRHRVSWDGRNNGGRIVARGMYFIRIVAPEIDEIRKVMVVK